MPVYTVLKNSQHVAPFAGKRVGESVETNGYYEDFPEQVKLKSHEPYWNFNLKTEPMVNGFTNEIVYVIPRNTARIVVLNVSSNLITMHNHESTIGIPIMAGSLNEIEEVNNQVLNLRIVNTTPATPIQANQVIVLCYDK